jgi:two-component system, LytTR family, response regulator LytT
MKIAIIEDEKLTADDLAETIIRVDPAVEITAILYSVEQALGYFAENKNTDLIFSDIQLGDGLSFDIFKRVAISTPVIFCTAYDEYALKAFKTNGIDYVLKPFTTKTIAAAIEKYKSLKEGFTRNIETYSSIADLIRKETIAKESSVLVYFKDKIIPVRVEETALFYVENEMTHLITFAQKIYTVGKSLEELEKVTAGDFYRANRKVLINRKAIKDASQFFHRKLVLNLTIPFAQKEPITVSKIKVMHFLNWLAGT